MLMSDFLSDSPDLGSGAADVKIGETVMLHMFRKKMKQGQLARALTISQSALSRKLRGYSTWSVFDWMQSARELETPAVELLPEESLWVLFGDQETADAMMSHMRELRANHRSEG